MASDGNHCITKSFG